MITIPTTLILGAGASADVGYPIAGNLKHRILSTIEDRNALYTSAIEAGFTEEKIKDFREDFDSSALSTIDEFLRFRQDHRDIGKFAIAHEITMYEDEKLLKQRGAESWYYTLRQKLGPHCSDLEKNRLRIITFNYDRSFQHYLFLAFNAVSKTHSDPAWVQATLSAALSPIHIHGHLSALPWQSPQGRKYARLSTASHILECARGIVLPDEKFTSDLKFGDGYTIKNAILESERVFFLGFGFAKSNIEKLSADLLRDCSNIGASAVSFDSAQQDAVRAHFPKVKFSSTINDIIKEL